MFFLNLVAALLASGSAMDPRLHLDAALDPEASRLVVDARLTGAQCEDGRLRLHLNRSLEIVSAEVDGEAVAPILDPPGATRFWVSAARPIDLPCPRSQVRLRYEGQAEALHPDGRNQVSPQLVELSLYGAWYPIGRLDRPPNWTLQVTMPAGLPAAVSGVLVTDTQQSDVRTLNAVALAPSDPALVVLPYGLEETVSTPGATARLLVPADLGPGERASARALALEAAEASAWLTGILGPPTRGDAARPELVIVPRTASIAYARTPLIVMAVGHLVADDADRGHNVNVRHETAHFWSRARTAEDDWLNEGTAEYLALVRTADVEGEAARARTLAWWSELSDAAPAAGPVTTGTGDDLVRKYGRPVLLFTALEQRFGRSAVLNLLRAEIRAGDGTTDAFVGLAREAFGPDIAGALSVCVLTADWATDCPLVRDVAGGAP